MITRNVRTSTLIMIALAALSTSPTTSPAVAATVIVSPGAGTLQAAIDAANPKDQLRLQGGTYTGPVTVNKTLKIYCYGDATPCVIDGDCAAAVAVDVTAEGVTIANKKAVQRFRIMRGTDTNLRVANSSKVQLAGLEADDIFSGPACGTETTGLEIAASTKVKVKDVTSGYKGYVHDIAIGAKVQITKSIFANTLTLSGPAFLIADSGIGADKNKGGVDLLDDAFNTAADGMAPPEVGIQLVNSDGMRIRKNYVLASFTGFDGAIGIALDPSSDRNLVFHNDWDTTQPTNQFYSNAGTENCAKKNVELATNTPLPDSCP